MEIILENLDKQAIIDYLKTNKTENSEVLIDYLNKRTDIFSRADDIGHVTCSAFIVSDDLANVLLIHHAKYDMWLSPGGHGDDGETILQAASREVDEETGVKGMSVLTPNIFDIDIHRIPYSAKKDEAEHWHFDVRYAFKAPANVSIDLNEVECKGYQWKPLKDLLTIDNVSLKRQSEKATALIEQMKPKTIRKFKM
jgi:8-oxo-dGTP pyrophosphatase MutT (NUDIX family)